MKSIGNEKDDESISKIVITTKTGNQAPKSESKPKFEQYIIKGLKKEKKPYIDFSPKFSVTPREAWLEPYKYDWQDFWPTAATFSSSDVPLPLRQGVSRNHLENDGIPPDKFANMELMKLTNFLHLTPEHIRRQCEALRHLCTEWPTELASEDEMRRHFPVEVIQKDFVFAAKSLRDPRARVVTLRVPLTDLSLDEHARAKFLRLLGPDSFEPASGCVQLRADRCPSKQQNYDYLLYLLRALCQESRRTESWEEDMEEADWPTYRWDKSVSRQSVLQLLRNRDTGADAASPADEELLALPQVKRYADAVTALHDQSEDEQSLREYKDAVTELLFEQTGDGSAARTAA